MHGCPAIGPSKQVEPSATGCTAPRLALISCGLGNTNRGFEVSTARWYDALRKHSRLDVCLICGGNYADGKRLWNIPRNSIISNALRHIPMASEQLRWELSYGVEQVSFWSALNFELLKIRPDVVWTKDVPLAHLISASRAALGLKFKLIFANGGGFRPRTYANFDLIQQIEQEGYEEALKYGVPPEKMELISNCMTLPDPQADRTELRRSLGLPPDVCLIVCVAAWNRYHKRIDYLLKEVAKVPDDNVRLFLCGTPEVDTSDLRRQGRELLGNRVHWLTVQPDRLVRILQAADVFVLPSLRETFGNALVEAAMCGLPIVVHPHRAARNAIKDEFWMTDLSAPGNLTNRLLWLRQNASEASYRAKLLQTDVISRFDERTLVARFETMARRVLLTETNVKDMNHRALNAR